MKNVELKEIVGGSISGNFLNYLSKIITTIYSIGQSIGSAINYLKNGKTC